ncbi:MAG: selenocysteine-specific translation elongation factor, partial [Pseudomonadales bacterium]
MIIATAGHVDHGKTLLVNAITGIDTDRLDDEKQRGLTIDLGFAYTDLAPGCRLGFIDVPGHIKFINNMLAGVGAVDYALLVVAADDGPMPQTREHLAVLDLLQVGRGMVALTKIDRVDNDRLQQVKADINHLLTGTSLANADIHPVSAVTGQGIDELTKALESAASSLEQAEPAGHFRLAIDRCFSVKGTGLVVTGSVFAGQIGTGETLYLTQQDPSRPNTPVRVRGIHTQNQPADAARAGDRCALNISGQTLSRERIHRGDWLVGNEDHRSTDRLDAEIKLLASETSPLRHWTPVHMHAAARHVTGRVATLNAKRIEPGETGLVQIVLSCPINVCRNDRIILRDQSAARTLGGGRVIDPFSPKRGRAKPARLAHLQALAKEDIPRAINGLLDVHPEGLYLPTLFDAF